MAMEALLKLSPEQQQNGSLFIGDCAISDRQIFGLYWAGCPQKFRVGFKEGEQEEEAGQRLILLAEISRELLCQQLGL